MLLLTSTRTTCSNGDGNTAASITKITSSNFGDLVLLAISIRYSDIYIYKWEIQYLHN